MTAAKSFRALAMGWLRDQHNFDFSYASAGPSQKGNLSPLRLRCSPRAASDNGRLSWCLHVLILGAALTLLASRRGLAPAVAYSVGVAGAGLLLVGCALLFAMARIRRPGPETLVELRARGSDPTPTSEEDLLNLYAVGGSNSWCVSELGFTPEALARAGALGVLCFVVLDARIVEAR